MSFTLGPPQSDPPAAAPTSLAARAQHPPEARRPLSGRPTRRSALIRRHCAGKPARLMDDDPVVVGVRVPATVLFGHATHLPIRPIPRGATSSGGRGRRAQQPAGCTCRTGLRCRAERLRRSFRHGRTLADPGVSRGDPGSSPRPAPTLRRTRPLPSVRANGRQEPRSTSGPERDSDVQRMAGDHDVGDIRIERQTVKRQVSLDDPAMVLRRQSCSNPIQRA